MRVQVTVRESVAVLAVSGDLNAESQQQLRDAVEENMASGIHDYVLELSGLTGLDSEGLESLTWLQRRSEELLGLVCICGADETTRKILEMTRLDRRFDVYDTVDSALAGLSSCGQAPR